VALMRICLDTSAYSHFKRGTRSAVLEISSASWIGVPAVALGELRSGFRLGRRATANESELRAFLAHPVVVKLDVDDEVATIYAEIVGHLRRAGTPIPTNDIWIAATAAREGAAVVTFDAHFTRIAAVRSRVLSS
jgi:tRNA(fMet)-specific endonuclease VapC